MTIQDKLTFAVLLPVVGVVVWAVKLLVRTGLRRIKDWIMPFYDVFHQTLAHPEVRIALMGEVKKLSLESIRTIGGLLRRKLKGLRMKEVDSTHPQIIMHQVYIFIAAHAQTAEQEFSLERQMTISETTVATETR